MANIYEDYKEPEIENDDSNRSNHGRVIMAVGGFLLVVGIIASLIIGGILATAEKVGLGILFIIGGIFVSWLSYVFMSGVGEGIDNTYKILEILENKRK